MSNNTNELLSILAGQTILIEEMIEDIQALSESLDYEKHMAEEFLPCKITMKNYSDCVEHIQHEYEAALTRLFNRALFVFNHNEEKFQELSQKAGGVLTDEQNNQLVEYLYDISSFRKANIPSEFNQNITKLHGKNIDGVE